LVSLGSWQLLHFFPNNLADSVEESRQGRVILPGASLPQERVLVGGLVSENEDVHDGKGIKELKGSWKSGRSSSRLGHEILAEGGCDDIWMGFEVEARQG
jgi:hypothetical protein